MESKVQLQSSQERKELLTEHLAAIIEQVKKIEFYKINKIFYF